VTALFQMVGRPTENITSYKITFYSQE